MSDKRKTLRELAQANLGRAVIQCAAKAGGVLEVEDDATPTTTKSRVLQVAAAAALLRLHQTDDGATLGAAVIGPTFDLDVGSTGDDDDDDRLRFVRRALTGAINTFVTLAQAYRHEYAHAAVGEHYGYTPKVYVEAHIEMDDDNVGIRVAGGRCAYATEVPIPDDVKAQISAAGCMGELTAPLALMPDMGEPLAAKVLRDSHYWLGTFRAIRENADEKDGEPPRPDVVFASGSDDDAQEFYAAAPTKGARLAAVNAVAEILAPRMADIEARATKNALAHLTALNKALALCVSARKITDAAIKGRF